jgi:C4-dicarboxylate-specific signal transduction histidine kinase
MRAVVRDLATFARPEEERPGRVDLRPIVESCLNVAWSEIRRRHARLVRDLEPLAPRSHGRPQRERGGSTPPRRARERAL